MQVVVKDIFNYNYFTNIVGSERVSVSDGGLLYILAEVKQGNSPVIGARVM